jgi:cytochrome P450
VPASDLITSALYDDRIRLGESEFHTFAARAVFAELRRTDPVHFYPPLNTWILTKYHDIRTVSRDSTHFSVAQGIDLNSVRHGELSTAEMFGEGGEFLAQVDPPRHTELRRALSPAFTARAVNAREERIRLFAKSLVDQLRDGAQVDWVTVAQRLPIMVGLDLLGLPGADVDQVRVWSEAMERLSYPLSPDELIQVHAEFAPLSAYLAENVERKRHEPGDDLMTYLIAASSESPAITAANVLMLLITVLGAGNDTMRSLLTGMVLTLAEHPDQLARLAADPDLARAAVEESLRWITPARGFVRTVSAQTELRGRQLRPGERVYLAYESGNRDEDVFTNPDVFDITAPRGQHASFGFGTHVCIGAAFARIEATALLRELVTRFPHFELAGPAERMVAVLRNGWHRAPMVFHADHQARPLRGSGSA